MIPLNNLSSRTKYEKNDFLNLTSPLKEIKNAKNIIVWPFYWYFNQRPVSIENS